MRSAALLCGAAIAFGICFVMLQEAIGSESPALGLLLMFYFMGLARVAEPLFVLRMPKFIRDVRAWEARGVAYQRVGVQRFGRLVRKSPLRFLNAPVYLATRHRDLRLLYRQASSAEATHFWAALLFTPYVAFVWAQGQKGVAALFLVIQALFNVYPILHLRMLRGRLVGILARRLAKRGDTEVKSIVADRPA